MKIFRPRASAGFSLLEMLMVMGMMGVAGYIMTSMLKNGSQGQKTLMAQDDARVLTENIANLLSSAEACQYTFGDGAPASIPGQPANPVLSPAINANPTRPNGTTITSVYDGKQKKQFAKGEVYGNRGLSLYSITIGGSGADPKTNIERWTPSGTSAGTAFVQVDWQQTGSGGDAGIGPKHLIRYFMVYATKLSASNTIVNCTAQAGGVADPGVSPIGTIQAWHKSMVGTPGLPDSWKECDGQLVSDPNSPYYGRNLPKLNSDTQDGTVNSGMFLRGASTSGTPQKGATAVNGLNLTVNGARGGDPGMGYHTPGWGGATLGAIVKINSTDPETRPANMSVVWIMRIK